MKDKVQHELEKALSTYIDDYCFLCEEGDERGAAEASAKAEAIADLDKSLKVNLLIGRSPKREYPLRVEPIFC